MVQFKRELHPPILPIFAPLPSLVEQHGDLPPINENDPLLILSLELYKSQTPDLKNPYTHIFNIIDAQ